MTVPKGATDCHAHVFGPEARFPYIEGRSYTPPERLPAAFKAMLARLGLTRGVIVQPSVYGLDNRATLAAIKELGSDFRGVAVLPPDVDDKTLADFAAAGIRGVRMGDILKGGVPLVHLEAMAARLKGTGWHIQVFAEFSAHPELCARLAKLGVTVVIDHLGLIDPTGGVDDAGLKGIVKLLSDGVAYVKLSGAYISSKAGAPYDDVAPVARAYVAAAPDRLVWGSDWPHPSAAANPPDDAALLRLLDDWAPDAGLRRRILVDNPATLYGFSAA